MVSDVDDIVAQEICNAEKISKPQAAVATSAVTPSPASATTSSPQPQHRNSSESEKPNNKGRNWIIGLAVIAGVYWFANRPDDSAPSSTSDISSSTYSATTDTSSTINSSSASESETSPVEQTPPIGTNLVLSRAQIKYCLAESIRLEAAREYSILKTILIQNSLINMLTITIVVVRVIDTVKTITILPTVTCSNGSMNIKMKGVQDSSVTMAMY